MAFKPNFQPSDIERETDENPNDYFDSLFASPKAAEKLDSKAKLRKSFETIGLPTENLQKVLDLSDADKKAFADAILKKMFVSTEMTWENYFKEAPYTSPGVEGKQTIEAMKDIHRILREE